MITSRDRIDEIAIRASDKRSLPGQGKFFFNFQEIVLDLIIAVERAIMQFMCVCYWARGEDGQKQLRVLKIGFLV